MATKNNPGKFDCYAKAGPDEPMFVLLARDRHGPALIRMWADLRQAEGEDPAKVAEARKCATDMEVHRLGLRLVRQWRMDAIEAASWLYSDNASFGQLSPVALVEQGRGGEVHQMLDRMARDGAAA